MELSAAYCNSNKVIGDPNIPHQWEDLSYLWENTQDYSLSSKFYSDSEKPTKKCASPTILSFGCPDSPGDQSQVYQNITIKAEEEMKTPNFNNGTKRSYETMVSQGGAKKLRPPSLNQEHVIAERIRREKLTQKFIALSALVPGLKKMDKASILGDAIEYMKKLKEKVRTLEEQAVMVKKKSQLSANHDDGNYEKLPDIEVRVSGKSFLVKIHCGNHKGVVVKVLSEIENLHLTVTNIIAVPFAASSLDITVIAQIEEKFSMTVEELVKKLSSAVKDFI